MEGRMVIKLSEGRYQLLKPLTDGNGWHKYGKNKGIKAISDLLKSGRFALTANEGIIYEVGLYRRKLEKKKEVSCYEKGLESKTI